MTGFLTTTLNYFIHTQLYIYNFEIIIPVSPQPVTKYVGRQSHLLTLRVF